MALKADREAWLREHRRERCPSCEPRSIPFSLVKNTAWCPTCRRVWRFRYFNIDAAQTRAYRVWWYLDAPQTTFRIQ